jgi:hypothetical protein
LVGPSVGAYQGWLDNPWRANTGDELKKLLVNGEVGAGIVFEIRESVEND